MAVGINFWRKKNPRFGAKNIAIVFLAPMISYDFDWLEITFSIKSKRYFLLLVMKRQSFKAILKFWL